MALVLLNSWRPRTRDPILIVPEEEAVLRLQATLMQAIFRGYVARRWFRSVLALRPISYVSSRTALPLAYSEPAAAIVRIPQAAAHSEGRALRVGAGYMALPGARVRSDVNLLADIAPASAACLCCLRRA